MAKRLSYDHVKRAFEDRGYELLEKVYKNSATKMRFRCPKHPNKDTRICYNDLRNGAGCRYCGYESISKKRRAYTLEDAKRIFNERGYELLEYSYRLASDKLRYRCRKHPDKELYITLRELNSGNGCPFCGGVGRKTFAEVKADFEYRGYKLLENEYVNNKTKMRYICPDHPNEIQSITYSNFNKGQGCPRCAGKVKLTIDVVRKAFEEVGLELLDSEVGGKDKKMLYRCPLHPEKTLYKTYASARDGHGCPLCAKEHYKGKNHPMWNKEKPEKEREVKREYPEYYEWRRRVFKRDDYTCQICGDCAGGNLVAHHLDGYDWCKNKRTDDDNGITLCEDCHNKFHSKYGWGGNTEEQFWEWVQQGVLT